MDYLKYFFTDKYYCSAFICAVTMCVIFFSNYFVWNIACILILIFVLLEVMFISLTEPETNYKKFLSCIGVLLILSTYFIFSIMVLASKNNTQSCEILEVEKNVELYHNDTDKAFILFTRSHNHKPLMLYVDDLPIYESLKRRFENGEIKLEKKKTKRWYKEKASINYYLDERIFR